MGCMWGDNRMVGTIPTSPSRGLQVGKAGDRREGMHKNVSISQKESGTCGKG